MEPKDMLAGTKSGPAKLRLVHVRPARRLCRASLAAALLAAATVACGGAPSEGPAGADATPPAATHNDNVTWVERTFEKESGRCDTDNDAVPCTRVQFDWVDVTGAPGNGAAVAINGPIQGWLQRPVFEDDGGTPEQIAAGLQQTHDDLVAEFPDYDLPWYVLRKVAVAHDTPAVFALSLYEEMFTGGAHGIHTLLYRNHRPDSGALIALDDLLIEGGRAQLTAIAEAIFRDQVAVPSDTPLSEVGFWFDEDIFALPDNFLIDADGLLFHYNEYEIAAYAFGPTDLRVPWGAVEPLLRPDAPR